MVELFLKHGLSVIPVTFPEKRPILPEWKQYQTRMPTPEEAKGWILPLAVIAGKVSGGLICIDFDNAGSEFPAWTELVHAAEPGIMSTLVTQKTPSGGFHVLYRCPEADQRNEKLAQLPNNEVLIETRGEGGYFLCAPSKGYELTHGKLSSIPTITLDTHRMLISLARTLNQKQAPEKKPAQNGSIKDDFDLSPLDDYDAREDGLELLKSNGWTEVFAKGETVFLKRPGKTERGISATWNFIPNRFYPFTTSTEFENRLYGPSGIYAAYFHHGNITAAVNDLIRQGYGRKKQKQETPQQGAQPEAIQPKRLTVKTAKDFGAEIDNLHRYGIPKGVSTGIPDLDNYFLICRGHLTIVSGIPTHGKSEVMDAIMVNVSIQNEQWKSLIFSPENYPIEMHFQKLSEKYIGTRFRKFSADDLERAKRFCNNHFLFIDPSEETITVDDILKTAEDIKPDLLLIDPWNELESSRPAGISETDYIGNTLTRIRKFARKHKIAVFIVAHPQKMRRDKDGSVSRPNMYDISGSAHWYNKSDNGFLVWRNFEQDYTEIIVEKVKFKYYGSRTNEGDVKLNYETNSGRYEQRIGPKGDWGK